MSKLSKMIERRIEELREDLVNATELERKLILKKIAAFERTLKGKKNANRKS